MKLSPKQKKWGKRILILLAIRVVVGGLLYYVIVYRFKEIVQFAIDRESKKAYAFDAADIDVSLWDKHITINDAILRCRDTSATSPHYEVRIPTVYFSIQSWKDLVFHKRVSVDSLSIGLPEIKVHEHFARERKEKQLSFQTASISENLQKLLLHLNVRTFNIHGGGFNYSRLHGPEPLIGQDINLSILDFSKKDSTDNSLLSASDIDILLGRQHWILPDGNHEVSFSKMHFSGKNQRFELDSVVIHTAPVNGKGEMEFSADKLFFNSKQLAALYTSNELLIDTLICVRPFLRVPPTAANANSKDSAANITYAVNTLFRNVNFKYIGIQDGSFSMRKKGDLTASDLTEKTNLTIHNLSIDPASGRKIKIDSIDLNVKNIVFYSKDSMSMMEVGNLSLKNNDLIIQHARYLPTDKNTTRKGIQFTTPALTLHNFSLDALMEKRLQADAAVLMQPAITIVAIQQKKGGRQANRADTSSSAQLYQTLHTLQQMISVPDFRITEGSVTLNAAGAKPVKMQMAGLNANILLDRFLSSDSLVEIKRAMPRLSIRKAALHSGVMDLQVNEFTFNGTERLNNARDVQMNFKNGSVVTARQLHWHLFDWDLFQNHQIVFIDQVDIGELNAAMVSNGGGNKKPGEPEELPVIHIEKMDVVKATFSKTGGTSNIRFDAADIHIDKINSKQQFFIWGNASAALSNIEVKSQQMSASAKNILLSNAADSKIEAAAVTISKANGVTKVQVPLVTIGTNIHSTDPAVLQIRSVVAESPVIAIDKKTAIAKSNGSIKKGGMSFKLLPEKMIINDASFDYHAAGIKDTLALSSKFSITANGLQAGGKTGHLFEYENVEIKLAQNSLTKGDLAASLPAAALVLTNLQAQKTGDKLAIASGVQFNYNNAHVKITKTDTTGLELDKLTGSFSKSDFHFTSGTRKPLYPLIKYAQLDSGNFLYRGKNITAKSTGFSWLPGKDEFTVTGFDVTPNLSMEESFKRSAWQKDYLVVKGDAITLSGINFEKYATDSAIVIRKILLSHASLSATKDMRMPFRHGIEKPMFTQLIKSLPVEVSVDTVLLDKSDVTVYTSSPRTKKWAGIPFKNIDAIITHVKTRDYAQDTLTVLAKGQLYDNNIHRFYFREFYGDSLASFIAESNISSMNLPGFNQLAIPLGAVSVDMGRADTLYSTWRGNRYAAFGKMDFRYKSLKVRVLDKDNINNGKLLLRVESWLANLLLRNANNRTTNIFVIRDPERAPFNYWVKAKMSGMLTSVGVKRNKKYVKNYKKLQKQYSLPVIEE